MTLIESLSLIERKALLALSESYLDAEGISSKAGLNLDQAFRAIEWLNQKGLAEIREDQKKSVILTDEGKKALKDGLVERILANELARLKGKADLRDLIKKLEKEANIALGFARKKAWVGIENKQGKTIVSLTGLEKEKSIEEKLIEGIGKGKPGKLGEEEKSALTELMKRGLVQESIDRHRLARISAEGLKARKGIGKVGEEVNVLTSDLIRSGEWRKKGFRTFNIQDPCPPLFAGKKQPYMQFLEQVRTKLVELGFKEMQTRMIELEFYNFDVLFQPQNHPARSWTDTFQLRKPVKGRLPEKKVVQAVKASHEKGLASGSRGWGHEWSEETASKLMPLAHGTANSAMQLVKGVEIPGKYFTIARVFRPDVMDATHLTEFNQLEGFVVDETINFRHLLGMLKQFAVEVAGAEKVRFIPDYYPFTEPSVQLNALHPELGWIEFAGAGMFRPEVLRPLGIDAEAVAWGMGVDRLAMFKLGIKDMRDLFSQNLEWLRQSKMVV
jgi:phenylalanyl-tRNA synthetase alpha chain